MARLQTRNVRGLVPLWDTRFRKSGNAPRHAVTRVKGEIARAGNDFFLASDIPAGLRRKILEGHFTVFVDWKRQRDANARNKKVGGANTLGYQDGSGRVLSAGTNFLDSKGTRYRYLDVKGGGMPLQYGASAEHPFGKGYYGHEGVAGLMDYNEAAQQWLLHEKLAESGVKTAKPLAIIELKELLDAEGNRMSVAEAVEKELIPKNFRPVLFFRAVTETNRLQTLARDPKALAAYVKANARVFGGAKPENYFHWVMRKAGENLARIHDAGIAHGNYSEHNITADASVLDPDMSRALDAAAQKRDLENGRATINWVLKDYWGANGLNPFRYAESEAGKRLTNSLLKVFQEGYDNYARKSAKKRAA